MTTINQEELALARKLLAEAIAERGEDYVYKSPEGPGGECVYIEKNEAGALAPSCLVGCVLVGAGVPAKMMLEVEGQHAEAALGQLASDFDTYPFTDPIVIAGLNRAQAKQDDGDTWGDALRAFESEIARLS